MRTQVLAQRDNRPKSPPAEKSFIRVDSSAIWCSAEVKHFVHDWENVDFYYDEEAKQLFITKNNDTGLYRVTKGTKNTAFGGLAIFTKLQIQNNVRIPVKLTENEIIVEYANFKQGGK